MLKKFAIISNFGKVKNILLKLQKLLNKKFLIPIAKIFIESEISNLENSIN